MAELGAGPNDERDQPHAAIRAGLARSSSSVSFALGLNIALRMGATGWSYFVPYEADISAALQRLREDVFTRGEYVYGDGVTDDQRKAILEKVRPEMDPWMQKVQEEAAKLQEPFIEEVRPSKGSDRRSPRTFASATTLINGSAIA